MLLQVELYLLAQFTVVRTLCIEPEDCWRFRLTCTCHGQLNPVADCSVFSLTCTPDIAFLYLMAHEYSAIFSNNTHDAIFTHLEGLVVRAVLFSFHRHQTNVRHSTHGCWVERTVSLTEVDHLLVDTRVS